MWQLVFRYGLLIAAVGLLLQLSRYIMVPFLDREEVTFTGYALAIVISVLFIVQQRKRKQTVVTTDPADVLRELGISHRELEVLKEMSQGSSNKEIADKLFIAESTVKTHVSNLLMKLHAKRRTEAIHKARDYRLID